MGLLLGGVMPAVKMSVSVVAVVLLVVGLGPGCDVMVAVGKSAMCCVHAVVFGGVRCAVGLPVGVG